MGLSERKYTCSNEQDCKDESASRDIRPASYPSPRGVRGGRLARPDWQALQKRVEVDHHRIDSVIALHRLFRERLSDYGVEVRGQLPRSPLVWNTQLF